MNILKISFKRKKFFIHQRQKQVSSAYACFVSRFPPPQLLQRVKAVGQVQSREGRAALRWEENGTRSPEDPAVLCRTHSACPVGEVICFGVR